MPSMYVNVVADRRSRVTRNTENLRIYTRCPEKVAVRIDTIDVFLDIKYYTFIFSGVIKILNYF